MATKKKKTKTTTTKKTKAKEKPAKKKASTTTTTKKKKSTTTKKKQQKAQEAAPAWALQGKGQAVGLHVDDDAVWAGWDSGDVVCCDHDGNVLRRWKLPEGCSALVADEDWRYAGCDDGNVYDLTGRAPRVAYEVDKDARILWIDIFRGRLIAGDSDGCLSAFDVEQRRLFRHDPRSSDAWMARADSGGCYLGNDDGVSCIGWDGRRVWHFASECVGFGVVDGADLVVYVGDHEEAEVVRLRKDSGDVVYRASCFSTADHYDRAHNAAACAAGTDVDYGATCNTLFAFDRSGNKKLEVATTSIGTPCSMAFHDGKLFVVTHKGVLARFDVDDLAAHTAAPSRRATLSAIGVSARDVEEGDEGAGGVVVECVEEGSKLKVRVVSPGFRADWFCQFPRDIREAGARFVVDGVREGDGFYRVFGDIKRLR